MNILDIIVKKNQRKLQSQHQCHLQNPQSNYQ